MNVKDGLFSNLEPIEKKNTEKEEEKIENEIISNKRTSAIETNNNNNEEPITNASDGLYFILFYFIYLNIYHNLNIFFYVCPF